MPSFETPSHGVPAVRAVSSVLEELLRDAETIKPSCLIEPPLNKADFEDLDSRLQDVLSSYESTKAAEAVEQRRVRRFAVIETAVRDLFSNLVAITPIDAPNFVRIWNLFDLLSIFSDSEQCDPALLFWLVEELLDSQAIAGCRKIFDFLESRRERITAKHFKQKQLVILRSCNELLRRLSRAEDTAFCGRVFIFMFQSFPLGDKSSVNLRGEYHVENVTTYDDQKVQAAEEGGVEKMDVDAPATNGAPASEIPQGSSRSVSFEAGKAQGQVQTGDKAFDPDTLYPTFWALQESFSQPKKLFDAAHFANFKKGLESTITAFRSVNAEQGARPSKQQAEDGSKRPLKRRRGDDGVDFDEGLLSQEEELANGFNPKYLTSRDLFELEINDLSFRRHILVQALIIMDFLLSLSAKAKAKLSTVNPQNKSVTYSDQLLSDEDAAWAAETKRSIADYLKQGSEGPYFFRMVETVLSRDKNWVRWKVENCPSIEMPPVSPQVFVDARAAAHKAASNKRLRPTPMGSLSLGFLADSSNNGSDGDHGMGRLQAPERYALPEVAVFRRKIADDDFEIEMPTNSQTKAAAVESKASKSWRALRMASRSRLAAFDRIDNPDKIDVIFEENNTQAEGGDADGDVGGAEAAAADTQEPADLPSDQKAIVLAGAASSTQPLAARLLEKHPRAFASVPPHTTRPPREGEVNGREAHFVNVQTFNMMRDGDQLLEYSEADDISTGTSRKAVDAVAAAGRVPVLTLSHDGAQLVKDMGYAARFIATEKIEAEKEGELYDLVVESDGDIEKAFGSLDTFIYGGE